MTERAANTRRREHQARPVSLPTCAAAAFLVVAFAAMEFSRPTRLGAGMSRDRAAAEDESARMRISGDGPIDADRAGSADIDQMRVFAAGRAGYVVWESRRPSGTAELKYRIWKRNLDGSGLAMLSGQRLRSGYAHLGPRISPDGRFVVFAGRSWNSHDDDGGVQTLYGGAYVADPFDAWVVEVDPATAQTGRRRELTALRGLLGGAGVDRFFVWKDRRTLYVNIPSQKGIFEIDVIEGRIGAKVVENVDGHFLLSPSCRWLFRAAPGGVAVVGLEPTLTAQMPGKLRALPGCQAVMSSVEDACIWVRTPGAASVLQLGGALGREDSAGRALSLRAATRRAHGPYHYAYFPSLSRDGRVVACGVSRFPPSVTGAKSYQCWLRHSHRSADYEIFLYEFDRGSGEVTGEPVRYSFKDHSAYPELVRGPVPERELRFGHVMDRFPEVWIESPGGAASVRAPDAAPVGMTRKPSRAHGRWRPSSRARRCVCMTQPLRPSPGGRRERALPSVRRVCGATGNSGKRSWRGSCSSGCAASKQG